MFYRGQSYTIAISGTVSSQWGQYKKERSKKERPDYDVFHQDKYPTRKMTIRKIKYV